MIILSLMGLIYKEYACNRLIKIHNYNHNKNNNHNNNYSNKNTDNMRSDTTNETVFSIFFLFLTNQNEA